MYHRARWPGGAVLEDSSHGFLPDDKLNHGSAHLNNHLLDGLEVMKALGFRYVANVVWVKSKVKSGIRGWLQVKLMIGLGQYFRGSHEICLFGVKGKLDYKSSVDPNRSCCDIPSVIFAPRRKHSQKPDEMYDVIEKTSYAPFHEIFSRYKRDGWTTMGNEACQFSLADSRWID